MIRIALVVVVVVAGCAHMFGSSGPAGDGPESHHVSIDGKVYRVGPYWGPECERERVGARKEEVDLRGNYEGEIDAKPTGGLQPNLAHDPADQLLRLVCTETILGMEDEPDRNTWVIQHFRFDELFFDHATAGMMLVQCLMSETCLGEGARPHRQVINNEVVERTSGAYSPNGRLVFQYYEIAMMRWYADRIDLAEVAKTIATWGLPQAAQQAFLGLVDKARTRVIAVSNELQPEAKRLFLEIPAAVYSQRAAAHAKHAAVIAELGALIERVKAERGTGVSDATLAKLRALRRAYHDSCRTDCTHDVVFADITRQLFWAYVSRGDSPGAMAESKLLEHLDPTAPQEIADKQFKAINDAIVRAERVSRAREQGVDAESARSTAHGAVLELGFGKYVYLDNHAFAIEWGALVPDAEEVGELGGKIGSLERKGANVLIRFQDNVSTWSEGTNCYETNRIDGISADGKLIYREACASQTSRTEREKVEPALVPADEAAGLHGGDEVVGFARGTGDARLGRIWIVKRGSRVARLREIPL